MAKRKKVIIMGAAGRDFHNFNTFFRDKEEYEVVAFTAYQIPDIEGRTYPVELAGQLYPEGIPIYAESDLQKLIKQSRADYVVFSYSDVPHEYVMHRASIANAYGANFLLLGARDTMIESTKPLVSICAVRTGSGKSQTSRKVVEYFKNKGLKVVAIRHPMPYGDLREQICQRFARYEDFDKYKCTIEEREEYEPYIEKGLVIYAGVDYEKILREAEKEADVIIWDGGNNDLPFYVPNLHIVVADPHRPGHELKYYPGEANFRMADVIVINKMDTAPTEGIATVKKNIREINPTATVIEGDSPITVDDPSLIRGKKVLVIEDGPTLTHGEMKYGAGIVAAKNNDAAKIVDPRPYAVGSIKATFEKYNHLDDLLPAMGYGDKQVKELEQTINATPCDAVIIGTPIDLGKLIKINKPSTRVTYTLKERGPITLDDVLSKVQIQKSSAAVASESNNRIGYSSPYSSPASSLSSTQSSVENKNMTTTSTTTSKMRHLISLKKYTAADIKEIIDLALKIKANPKEYWYALDHKTLIMLFEKTSTRTRLSFEAGMSQLGGHAIFLDARTSQLSIGSDFGDEIQAIMRYADILMYRAKKADNVIKAASYNKIPVMDACSEKYHPCQALGDLLTMAEYSGGLDKIKKITWLGIENNVSNTLKLAAAKLGIEVAIAAPEVDLPSVDPELDKIAEATGKIKKTLDVASAMKDTDYVHTDTWMNMEFFKDGKVLPEFKEQYEHRINKFKPYQLTGSLVDKSSPSAHIMHCMPCHIGYEISRDAVDHKNSIIFDQAENRMHAQKAIMIWLLRHADQA